MLTGGATDEAADEELHDGGDQRNQCYVAQEMTGGMAVHDIADGDAGRDGQRHTPAVETEVRRADKPAVQRMHPMAHDSSQQERQQEHSRQTLEDGEGALDDGRRDVGS